MSVPKKAADLSRDQGKAFSQAVEYIKKNQPSLTLTAQDYVVTLVFSRAVGNYVSLPEGGLQWQTPIPSDNQYLKIIVQDRQDLRFIPSLQVFCRLTDSEDNFIAEKWQPFNWHPFLHHYGQYWTIPHTGDYTAKITIKSPSYNRLDESLGNRYRQDVTLDFGPFSLNPASLSA